MSTILRSGKFIRCFASAARTIFNSPKGHDNNLFQSSRSLTAGYSQTWSHKYATQAQSQTESLEPLLQRLDAEVKRFGRLSRRDLDDMLEEVRQRHSVTSSQSLLVIRCCGNLVPEELPQERTRLVEEIWKTLVDRGVPMDISHYNALLRVYIENEHNFSPNEFLNELEQKGIQPNRVTYQRLMWHHCQQGDVEGASRILELMRSNRLPLSSGVLNALVLGHARLGDAAGARAVVSALAGAGLQPTPHTYALLIGGAAARGDIEEVKKTLIECREKEIHLSDKDLMDVIEECAIGGHEEHIGFLLEQMQYTAGYNQEAISLILKLVTRGRENAALKVYHTLLKSANPVSDATSAYQGAFFVRHLVKAGCPTDTIIAICNQLQTEGSSPRAFFIAADNAIQQGKQELALTLFRVMNAAGHPIRQHYFWPLIIAKGKAKKNNEILNIVKMMVKEFKIGTSAETLREYVIPNLKMGDPGKIIDNLRECGVPLNLAGSMLVHCLLSKNQLSTAAALASKYGIKININFNDRSLTSSLNATKDIDSFVTLLHLSTVNSPRANQNEVQESANTEADSFQEQREAIGKIIYNMTGSSSGDVIKLLPQVLEALYAKGLGISAQWAEKIEDSLGSNMTSAISETLAKLTAEDLEPQLPETPSYPSIQRRSEDLEVLITNLEAKGEITSGLKKQLLTAYVREKEVEKIEEYLKRLEAENFVITAGTSAMLIDFYAQNGNLEKALKSLDDIRTKEPDFNLDAIKIMRIVNLLVADNQFEKAMEVVKSYSRKNLESSFTYKSLCWRILNTLAEEGSADKLQQMFDILKEKELIEINNAMLGPLIKVHLVSGDITKALQEFENLCTKYRCTPWKTELTKKLIAQEDAAGLQKLTDLSTVVHGEINSLYDLVFGFVECGRLMQARRILETPGMRIRNQRFINACERYGQEGKVDYLESLLEVTRELSHIDRSEVFQQLLNMYIRDENDEKALGLWTLLQEESLSPTDKFLIDLAQFLQSKNLEVPFVVPDISEPMKEVTKLTKAPDVSKGLIENFSKSLDSGDIDTALSIKQKLGSDRLTKRKVSELIEKSVHANKMEAALQLTISDLKMNRMPEAKVMRFLLNALAANGDVESFDKLGNILTNNQKRLVSFDNRRCNAILKCGKTMDFLNGLMAKINSASEEDLELLEKDFPAGGAIAILEGNPDALPKYIEIAEKYASKDILIPVNILWMIYFIRGQDKDAKLVWDKYMKKAQKPIMFKKILNDAFEQKNTTWIPELIKYMKSNENITSQAIGNAYSRQIDILVSEGKATDAMDTIQKALSDGCSLSDINRTALLRLKNSIESAGSEFTYEIPEKSKLS